MARDFLYKFLFWGWELQLLCQDYPCRRADQERFDFNSTGKIINLQPYVGETPFTRCWSWVMMDLLTLGWAKDLVHFESTWLRNWNWSAQNKNRILGMLQSCASCSFFLLNLLIRSNEYIIMSTKTKNLDEILSSMHVFFQILLFYMQIFIANPNTVHSCWNCGYSFNINFCINFM